MARQFGGAPVGDNRNAKIALFLSFFFLLLFAALAYRLLSTANAKTVAQPAAVVIREEVPKMVTRDVVVPLRRIEKGKKLLSSMFKIEERPAVGTDYGVVESLEGITGYFAATDLLPGQPVVKDAITSKQPNSAISQDIPPGFRAVTIKVDVISAVEGWARPGSRVDVSLIATVNGKKSIASLVENSMVLSANRNPRSNAQNPDQPVPGTVTLLVTAADSQKIQLGKSLGLLELTLRGDNNAGRADTDGGVMTLDDIVQSSKTSNQVNRREGGTLVMGGKKYLVSKSGELTLLGDK